MPSDSSRSRGSIPRICKQCGTEFLARNENRAGVGTYCSHACLSASRRTSPTVSCMYCGNTFLAKPAHLKVGWAKHCSLKCARASKRIIPNEYFWSKVKIGPKEECWHWQGSVYSRGYGIIRIGDRRIGAHRFSLELALGRPLLPGMFAIHSCDNPPCVNPSHLREGTAKMNTDDKIERGRQAVGVATNVAKFSDDTVREARILHAQGLGFTEIGRRFGVSRTTAHYAVSGRTWKHVPEDE